MKILLFVIGVLLPFITLNAQELNCTLTVNTQSVEGTNKDMFKTLEGDLKEFMNNYRFTDLVYEDDEKIECTFMILVKSYSNDLMKCELQVQASRPVFGSSYTTTLMNIRDEEVFFTYREFDVIEINNNTFESNLTAIMAYYAYLIIGLDLDSFGRLAGTEVFAMAENIVNLCQSRSDENEIAGWKAFDKPRNRYTMINNMTDERFKPMREYYYEYHRLALDNMVVNVDNSRAKIAEKIEVLRDLNRLAPSAPFILTFLDSKSDELINIFAKHGLSDEKKKVHEVLNAVNPTAAERYDKILE